MGANERLSINRQGQMVLKLKTPWRKTRSSKQETPKVKKLLIIICACLVFVASACSVPASENGKNDLSVSVRLTTGERSKDSSSQTTTITVERDAIVWAMTFSGRQGGTPPLRKAFRLSPADQEILLTLIRAHNLLVTDTLELPQSSSNYSYFRISVDVTLDGKKGAINISGMRTAAQVKQERLYQNTLTLVRELYRIMNSQDKKVYFEELILEPIRR